MTALSPRARAIWGKTDDLDRVPYRGLGRWLPLAVHLVDAGLVGGELWDRLGPLARAPLSRGLDEDAARARFVQQRDNEWGRCCSNGNWK